jgi:integrase
VLCEALKKFRAASPFNRDGDFVLCDVVGEAIDQSNFRRTVLYPLMDSLGIERGKNTHGFHLLRHTGATVLHELTGDIEISQRALGHASRSTTEIIYDHAEVVVGTETTGLLLDWLLGSDGELLERSDTLN